MIRIAVPSPSTPGRFAVVRRAVGIQPTVEVDGFFTEAGANKYARGLNHEFERSQMALALAQTEPQNRPIQRGLYTDEEAQ